MATSSGAGAGPTPPASPLDRWADTSDKLGKILDLVLKVGGGVGIVLGVFYTWLRDQVAMVSPATLVAATIALVAAGVVILIVTLALRARWGRWTLLALSIGGGVCLGLAVLLWVLRPPLPIWERVVARDVAQADSPQDLAVMVLRDQLSGAVSLIPGPPTYEPLLVTRRAGAAMQEQWAGYYVPLVTAGTAPIKLSLRAAGGVNGGNASLAVIAVVWEASGDGVRVGKPRYLGYDTLRSAIDVDVPLTASQRAALFAFIYPLTPDASATLPKRIEEAVDVQ